MSSIIAIGFLLAVFVVLMAVVFYGLSSRAAGPTNYELYSRDFVTESESLKQKREEAKLRMKQWGRVALLDGGEFSRENKVLPKWTT